MRFDVLPNLYREGTPFVKKNSERSLIFSVSGRMYGCSFPVLGLIGYVRLASPHANSSIENSQAHQ